VQRSYCAPRLRVELDLDLDFDRPPSSLVSNRIAAARARLTAVKQLTCEALQQLSRGSRKEPYKRCRIDGEYWQNEPSARKQWALMYVDALPSCSCSCHVLRVPAQARHAIALATPSSLPHFCTRGKRAGPHHPHAHVQIDHHG
jgi:hypothetical protein